MLSPALALTEWESIHQVLNTYPLAIDSKDFGLLAKVFTEDAFANYTGVLSNLNGLAAIQSGLSASVANVDSQHLLGTTLIDIEPPLYPHGGPYNKPSGGGDHAKSTMYFQATLFGRPYYVGSVVYLYGYYADNLVKVAGGWRIRKRQLVFQGPGFVGNTSLLGG